MVLTEKSDRQQLIEALNALVEGCFAEVKNLDLPLNIRNELNEFGKQLNAQLQIVVRDELAENSAKFVNSTREIKRVAEKISKDHEQLKKIAATFETIAELLEIAEQVAIIAAGYFK